MKSPKMLGPGDALPDLTFQAPGGETVRLRDLASERVLVVFFYPRDDSPGCTVESCSFRDHYEEFVRAGAEVAGISADGASSHERFKSKHRLPFVLLSDETGEARDAFGVKSTLGFLPGRATFVVDRGGVIRYAFDSQLRVHAHVDNALRTVRELAAASSANTPRV